MIDRADILNKVQCYVKAADLAIELLQDFELAGIRWPGQIRLLQQGRAKVEALQKTIVDRTITFKKFEKLVSDLANGEFATFDRDQFIENIQFATGIRGTMNEIKRLFDEAESFFGDMTDVQIQELFAE